MIKLDGRDMVLLGIAASATTAAFLRPEHAVIAGAVSGSLVGFVRESFGARCGLFDDRCIRRRMGAAVLVGSLVGMGFGMVRRGVRQSRGARAS